MYERAGVLCRLQICLQCNADETTAHLPTRKPRARTFCAQAGNASFVHPHCDASEQFESVSCTVKKQNVLAAGEDSLCVSACGYNVCACISYLD